MTKRFNVNLLDGFNLIKIVIEMGDKADRDDAIFECKRRGYKGEVIAVFELKK